MTLFVGSQGSISLPSVMFVNAAVSEIHVLNQNKEKKKSEIVPYSAKFSRRTIFADRVI